MEATLRVVPEDSDAIRAALSDYIRHVWDEVGLREWVVVLVWGEWCEAESRAIVSIYENRRYAEVRVCEDFLHLPADDQRHAVVHEAFHCRVHEVVMGAHQLENQLAPPTWQVWWGTYMRTVEHMVDDLASAFELKIKPLEW